MLYQELQSTIFNMVHRSYEAGYYSEEYADVLKEAVLYVFSQETERAMPLLKSAKALCPEANFTYVLEALALAKESIWKAYKLLIFRVFHFSFWKPFRYQRKVSFWKKFEFYFRQKIILVVIMILLPFWRSKQDEMMKE